SIRALTVAPLPSRAARMSSELPFGSTVSTSSPRSTSLTISFVSPMRAAIRASSKLAARAGPANSSRRAAVPAASARRAGANLLSEMSMAEESEEVVGGGLLDALERLLAQARDLLGHM